MKHSRAESNGCYVINKPRHYKTNKVIVRPAKTQISLGIRPVWSESLLCTWWVAKNPSFLHADSKDSDRTGRMPRLIWVFAGRTATLLVLSCRGSNRSAVVVNCWVINHGLEVSYKVDDIMSTKREWYTCIYLQLTNKPWFITQQFMH